MLPELSQYFPYMLSMVLGVGRINKDIFKENQHEFAQLLTKKSVHHVHELDRGVGRAKRHEQEFLEPPPQFCERLLVLPTSANTLTKDQFY